MFGGVAGAVRIDLGATEIEMWRRGTGDLAASMPDAGVLAAVAEGVGAARRKFEVWNGGGEGAA